MRLLAVCINSYGKLFSREVFNFSPEYSVSYDFEKSIITINVNDEYISGLYGDLISSVSAVIGRNGVGKSSLLNLIGNNVDERAFKSTKINGGEGDGYALIYVVGETDNHTVYYAETYNMTINNIRNLKCDSFYKLCDFYFQMSNENKNLYEVCVRPELKTNEIVFLTDDRCYIETENLTPVVLANVDDNIVRKKNPQCRLMDIYNAYVKLYNIGAINSDFVLRIDKSPKMQRQTEFFLNAIIFEPDVSVENERAQSFEELYADFLRKMFSEFCSYLLAGKPEGYDSSKVNKFVDYANSNIASSVEEYKIYFDRICAVLCEDYRFHSKLYDVIRTFEKFMIELINQEKYVRAGIDSFFISFPKKEDKEFEKLIKAYDELIIASGELQGSRNKKEVPFIIGRYKVSEGEERLLRIIASITASIIEYSNGQSIQSYSKKGNLIILVDEIEKGMHPEWSRSLIKYIIDVLNDIMMDVFDKKEYVKNLRNSIQLIFSTHSSLLLSDIVTDTNIFLEKDEKGQVNQVKRQMSFAANPMEMMKDKFFVDGYMGEFALCTINRVLENIKTGKADKKDKFIINQIGEPILRKKLEELYDERVES